MIPYWGRVGRDRPCLVCGRADWCLRSLDDSATICARVSQGAVRQVGTAGWLYRHTEGEDWPHKRRLSVRVPFSEPRPDLESLVREFRSAVDRDQLESLANKLGLSIASLQRLRIGWSSRSCAWSFPMGDSSGRARGIRLRTWAGQKFSVRGGHEGLFIPTDLESGGALLVAEGPTDTAALLDLGFAAIGRPSCRGGVELIVELIRRHRPRELTIVADRDEPGQHGASALASRLVSYTSKLRVITPPEGIKDARAWLRSGATHESVLQVIEAAERFRVRAHAVSIPRQGTGGSRG